MKRIIQLEELAMLAFSFLATLSVGFSWWIFWVLLLVPDVSMLGYLVNTKVGAFFYNLFHHRALGIGLIMAGYFMDSNYIILAGWIFFGHSAMDRVFGYGLKFDDNFKHTHLGWIGEKKD
jgi:hypothetical protein